MQETNFIYSFNFEKFLKDVIQNKEELFLLVSKSDSDSIEKIYLNSKNDITKTIKIIENYDTKLSIKIMECSKYEIYDDSDEDEIILSFKIKSLFDKNDLDLKKSEDVLSYLNSMDYSELDYIPNSFSIYLVFENRDIKLEVEDSKLCKTFIVKKDMNFTKYFPEIWLKYQEILNKYKN